MREINPYEPPTPMSEADVIVVGETFRPGHCPQCDADVSSLVNPRRIRSFDFRCPSCDAEWRVCTPLMLFACLSTIGTTSLSLGGTLWYFGMADPWSVFGFVLFLAIWILLEVTILRRRHPQGRYERLYNGVAASDFRVKKLY